MANETERTRAAREAAEAALVRVVHHYGDTPEFVVIGGLVPEILCSKSEYQHAGTTDIDVQVNLEIACGSTNMPRLELALKNAEFEPSSERVWRWMASSPGRPKVIVKFELLADLDNQKGGEIIEFVNCEKLGAVNLRGTGFASLDVMPAAIKAKIGGTWFEVKVNITAIAGFLFAKIAAAYSRRKPKDWYDIAFVLRNNDFGGVEGAANAIRSKFGDKLNLMRAALDDLNANFSSKECQGPQAYANQVLENHPEEDRATLLADAVVTIQTFYSLLYSN